MHKFGRRMGLAGIGALALTAALPALAQTFSLPPASPTPTPRPPGPVDADNPVVTAPRATPSPAPTAAPPPAPTPTPSASAAPTSPSATPRAVVPRTRSTIAAPGPAATPTPAPSITATLDSALDASTPPSISNAPVTTAAPSQEPARAPFPWAWLAGAAALLLGLGGVLWWSRRASAEPLVDFEPPVVADEPKSQPKPAPIAAAPPPPAPVPPPSPPAPAPIAAPASGLSLALEAERLSATLLNTTLQYQLRLTNHGAQALGPIAVTGDMVAAHSTLPVEQQLGLDGQKLELRHAVIGLAAGESVTLAGEIRLPLAAIIPIRAGPAALFIPLARFRAETSTADGAPLVEAHTFVVGEAPEVADAGLRPFRLDLGPRVYSRIGQREVGIPA